MRKYYELSEREKVVEIRRMRNLKFGKRKIAELLFVSYELVELALHSSRLHENADEILKVWKQLNQGEKMLTPMA